MKLPLSFCPQMGLHQKNIPDNRGNSGGQQNFHGRTTTIISVSHRSSRKRFWAVHAGFFEIIEYDNEVARKGVGEPKCLRDYGLNPFRGKLVYVPKDGYLKSASKVDAASTTCC